MSERKLPPDAEVLALLERGVSTKTIAQQYGASRQAVVYCLRQNGVVAPRGPMVKLSLPWQVRVAHNHAPEMRCLRTLERIRLGLPVRDRDRTWAENWAANIVSLGKVVAYDPDDGFYLVDREFRDGDELVRR